ncbi:MAG: OmpA family protein [Deltaproteobacteria bacterium]|nr:MAG: OmpA family protein [Deltaproteobacteria bacterium]
MFSFATIAPVVIAAAAVADGPLSYEYMGQTDGAGRAALTLVANEDLPPFTVVIRGDGQTIRKKVPGMRAGSRKKIAWKQRSRQAHYEMSIESDELSATFEFDVLRPVGKAGKIGNLVVLSDRDEIVEGHKVRYRAPSPLSSYEYKVYDTRGNVIAEGLVTKEIGTGEVFEVTWDSPAEVFMVYVKAENDFGGFVEYKLVPWSVEIPHTEVNFDSGKYDIKPDQEWKVKEALAVALHELVGLQKVNEAVGAQITPRLYIVGYTDTVGSAADNQKLSENRARAIAKYFYDHGFWAEIYYAGMGERGLRVPTGDNVDEVRNRRALYLLTVQQPAPGGQIPARWRKLADARPMPANFELPPYPERFLKHKEERERQQSGGAGAGGGGAEPSGGEDEGGAAGAGEDLGTSAGSPDAEAPGGAADETPPPVDGAPGASAKGCSVSGARSRAWLALCFVLALARRRRPA